MRKSAKRIFNLLEIIIFFFLIYYLFYINIDIKKAMYPIKYEEIVEECAKEYQIDPLMLYSIIKVESSFDEVAESTKGARGLMQITPSTGEWIAEKLKLDKFNNEDLFLPETNIMMGAWYIDYLISKFEGDMILALAAYNAGPAKVQNWLNDTSLTDNGQKLIQIPYKETENYVKKINSAYEQYKELYN